MTELPVTVCGYASLAEAQIAQATLAAFGIRADVPDQHAGGIVGDLVGGARGIRLQVPAGELLRAREILGLDSPAPVAPAPSRVSACPTCGVAIAGHPARRGWLPWRRRVRATCGGCGRSLLDLA